jgi:hypothetical protein
MPGLATSASVGNGDRDRGRVPIEADKGAGEEFAPICP